MHRVNGGWKASPTLAHTGDSRKEKFRGRDRLPWTAVLDGAINDKVMFAGIAEHPPECVGRARVNRVASDFALRHFASPPLRPRD